MIDDLFFFKLADDPVNMTGIEQALLAEPVVVGNAEGNQVFFDIRQDGIGRIAGADSDGFVIALFEQAVSL